MEPVDDFDFLTWLSRHVWTAFFSCVLVGTLIWLLLMTFTPMFNWLDNHSYNSSPQHLQAVSQKLADDCQQLAAASDQTARKAIEQDIYSTASTVDLSQVTMTPGVRVCVDNALSDVTK